jgi:hypothetical protein
VNHVRWSSHQSQSQSHIATDGQSASPSWCRAPFGTRDQMLSHRSDLYSMSRPVASSLTRGRICHLSFVLVLVKNCNIFTVQIYTIHKTNYKQYIHDLCQSRQCAADYAFLITFMWSSHLLATVISRVYFSCSNTGISSSSIPEFQNYFELDLYGGEKLLFEDACRLGCCAV